MIQGHTHKLPRWLAFILAPLVVSMIFTMIISTKIMDTGENNKRRRQGSSQKELSDMEQNYVMGEGPPPMTGGARLQFEQDLPKPAETEEGPDRNGAPPDNEVAVDMVDIEQEGAAGIEKEEVEIDEEDVAEIEDDDEEAEIENDGEEEETETEEEDAGDDDDGPRPRKKPKGSRWRGWPKPSVATHHEDHTTNKKRPLVMPRSVGNEWWRKSKLCFEVDYICHEQEKNEWFYYSPPNVEEEAFLFQPTMELKSAAAKYDGGKDRGEKRITIKVASSSKLKPEQMNGRVFTKQNSNDQCQISSTPTHVVLQSLFNDMIGEFYSRTLLRLYNFMTEGVNENEINAKLPWKEDIQFYVHIPYGNKAMLDGHKLLLSGMLSNPESPAAKSLVDLFVQDGATNDSSPDCQCYEKMVFCGYDVYTHPANILSKDLDPASDDENGNGNDGEQSLETGDANDDDNASSTTSNFDLKHTLWSAGKLDTTDAFDDDNCGRGTGSRGTEYVCKEWNGLRNFLSTNFVKHFPSLEQEIVNRRRDQLVEKGIIDESYKGNTEEFTVIGLTQRTYRRAWINLPDIIEQCNAASFERVICVEVNVENTSTPYEQLLLHRSLDVMIGVHGAQMTQAILLPKHAHVLELLPWITDYIRGKWVQTTNGPTPLGVIFHNTDLNHLGYSLDRSSVPLCEGVSEEELQSCFMRKRKRFIWENRDFVMESQAILQYIEQFVLFGREKERSCEEMAGQLDKRFVMYNIWCSKPKYWFPGYSSDGEKACLYGSDYPVDHTEKFKKDSFLFGSKEDCCTAFSVACQGAPPQEEVQPSSGLSLFHIYHESSKKEIKVVKLKEKKRRAKARAKQKNQR
ncbi:hypothetical protein ACHAXR_012002 [Thalassiosira sp. AJA248-18]